jgi:hypothetical protein
MALQLDERIGHPHQGCTQGRACQGHAAAIFMAAAIKVVQLHAHIGHRHPAAIKAAQLRYTPTSLIRSATEAVQLHADISRWTHGCAQGCAPPMHATAILVTAAVKAVQLDSDTGRRHHGCIQGCADQMHTAAILLTAAFKAVQLDSYISHWL